MYEFKVSLSAITLPLPDLRQKALHWAQQYEVCAFYEHNQIPYPYNGFRNVLAITSNSSSVVSGTDSFASLKYATRKGQWLFGMLSYDLKNQVENLSSRHTDHIGFPLIHFFYPEVLLIFEEPELKILSLENNGQTILNLILETGIPIEQEESKAIFVKNRISKENYLENVEKIRQHIEAGDVYELNYCQEFYAEAKKLFPEAVFQKLNKASPMPFAGFFKLQDKYLLCASPERFLKKEGSKLISQPIKGTIQRGNSPEEDQRQIGLLANDEKERAENMMIVDLVRNDLARTAQTGSVMVEEIFGIYGFQHVFQMISTITSELAPEYASAEAIKAAFPMGSMTGAPKIRAMELIEAYEATRRGLYSGCIGYFTPEGNFDFNVVIRSIQYNATSGYLSFMVGSAITYDSVPEKEYEECLLKAQGIRQALFG